MTRTVWLVLAIVASLALPVGSVAAADSPRANLPDIEDEVMCPICGTLLELSDSPQAERERRLIRELIARGETKSEIKDELVAQYGPEVLATPSGHGFDLLAWLIPGLALTLGIGGIALALAHQRAKPRGDGPPAPRPDPADVADLDRDMSSYDL